MKIILESLFAFYEKSLTLCIQIMNYKNTEG